MRRVGRVLLGHQQRRKELATVPRTQHTISDEDEKEKEQEQKRCLSSCFAKYDKNVFLFPLFFLTSSSLWFWFMFSCFGFYSSDRAIPRVFFHSSNFASDVYWLRQAFTVLYGKGEGGREGVSQERKRERLCIKGTA